MRRARNYSIYFAVFIALVVLISVTSLVTDSSGPGDELMDSPIDAGSPFDKEISNYTNDGGHYARCLYRNHIEGSRYFLEIKNVKREGQKLVSIESEGIEGEINVHAWVRLRGTYAPNKSLLKNRNRPHVRVEREQKRLDMLESQTWRLFESSETLVLSNIEVDEENPKSGFTAEIHYRIGGVDRDLASDLQVDGFILDDVYARNYGDRIP